MPSFDELISSELDIKAQKEILPVPAFSSKCRDVRM